MAQAKAQEGFTDADSRMMKHNDSGFDHSCNGDGAGHRGHLRRERAPWPVDYHWLHMTDAKPNPTLLDTLLTEAKLSNHAVVEASAGKLNHKNVQKARTGSRPVTDRIARTLTDVVNELLLPEEKWTPRKLFPGFPRGKATFSVADKPGNAIEIEGDEE